MTVIVENDTTQMDAAVDHYLSNSERNNKGMRAISKKTFEEALEKHGVTAADYKKVQAATDFETTAAARVALADVENVLKEASEDDRNNEAFRRSVSASVRLPTLGGATEVEVVAEKASNNPFRGEGGEGPEQIISHARVRTTINAKGRIDKSFADEGRQRIRAALGLKD